MLNLNVTVTASEVGLAIVVRPRCPKCKKEFMLNLKNYLPGKHRACFACGTVTTFDAALAERLQEQIRDLETSIQDVFESFWTE